MLLDKVAILGAGPSGMACAYTLAKATQPSLVIEKDDAPGGLCRTLNFHGYLFDIGGHRFISKSNEINKLWQKIMGDDMLWVKRLSRIYYKKRYFSYPLSFFDTFWNLGPFESFLCIMSYTRCKILKSNDDDTFEGWIINRFGKRLYDIFFKTYTEKVWAIACKDISCDWAQERIKGLSLRVALQKAILKIGRNMPKTLAETFFYPRTGPGEFYKRLQNIASANGTQFAFNKTVASIWHNGKRVISVKTKDSSGDRIEEFTIEYLFSSIPLPILIRILRPQPPEEILVAANNLRFRSLVVVNIILDREHVFPDQWVYAHSPEVKLGRIQNYKNWSPAMVVDLNKTSLGLEYFCTEGDSLWNMNDVDLVNFAVMELEKMGIASRRYLIDGFVVRRQDVYPVYSIHYRKDVSLIRNYLERFHNFHTMGRAGLFRYDNSDQAFLTGVYAAKNYLGKKDKVKLYEVIHKSDSD